LPAWTRLTARSSFRFGILRRFQKCSVQTVGLKILKNKVLRWMRYSIGKNLPEVPVSEPFSV
jgi:hypothetical protein